MSSFNQSESFHLVCLLVSSTERIFRMQLQFALLLLAATCFVSSSADASYSALCDSVRLLSLTNLRCIWCSWLLLLQIDDTFFYATKFYRQCSSSRFVRFSHSFCSSSRIAIAVIKFAVLVIFNPCSYGGWLDRAPANINLTYLTWLLVMIADRHLHHTSILLCAFQESFYFIRSQQLECWCSK